MRVLSGWVTGWGWRLGVGLGLAMGWGIGVAGTSAASGPLNVVDFGAVGRTNVDSTAAIQKAIDVASAVDGPKAVYVPAGVYAIRRPLVAVESLAIFGDSAESTVLQAQGREVPVMLRIGDGQRPVTGFRVENLQFNGGYNAYAAAGLVLSNAYQGDIRRNVFRYLNRFALLSSYSGYTTIANNRFDDLYIGGTAIVFDAPASRSGFSSHVITANRFTARRGDGIVFLKSSSGVAIGPGNAFEGCRVGIHVPRNHAGEQVPSIIGNFFEGNVQNWLIGDGPPGLVPPGTILVEGNAFAGTDGHPMVVSNAVDVTMIGNRFGVPLTIERSVTSLVFLGNTVMAGFTNLAARSLVFQNPGTTNPSMPSAAWKPGQESWGRTGFLVNGREGMRTTVPVAGPGGTTNRLVFEGGLLVGVETPEP